MPLPPSEWSESALRNYCTSVGYAYTTWSPFLGADFLATELQAAQTALASAGASRSVATATAPLSPAAILAGELQALSRAVGLPRVSHERLVKMPEAILAQVRVLRAAARHCCLLHGASLLSAARSPALQIHARVAALLGKLPPGALETQVRGQRETQGVRGQRWSAPVALERPVTGSPRHSCAAAPALCGPRDPCRPGAP